MKKNIIYIISILSTALFALQSCGLEDPFVDMVKDGSNIEIIFRPTSYEDVTVKTKASDNRDLLEIEQKIHTAYLLIYDNTGALAVCRNLSSNINQTKESISSLTISNDPLLTSGTLCFIANVPESFVNEWSTKSEDDSYETDLDKFHAAELDFAGADSPFSFGEISSTSAIGVPQVKFSDDKSEYCFPMYGEFALADRTNNQVSINIERLFAKIEVKISVGSGVNQFALSDYTVTNLPTKVALCEPESGEESICATAETGFLTSSNGMSSFNLVSSTDPSVANVVKNGNGQHRSFYFYMPEHLLGGVKTNLDYPTPTQSNKPDLLEGTDYMPTYVTIHGKVMTTGSNNDVVTFHEHKYDIYLGYNEVNNYDVARNVRYKNNVTINGVNGVNADNRIEIIGSKQYQNLVTTEAANCYIVTGSGKYMIPAYQGVVKNLSGASLLYGKPEIVWSDLEYTGSDPAIVIDNVNSNDSQILFEIKEGKFKAGNVLLALRANNEIIWSWHIWCCEDDPRKSLVTYSGSGASVMDRAIGATSGLTMSETGFESYLPDAIKTVWNTVKKYVQALLSSFLWEDGLYYQWGRKDPMRVVENNPAKDDDCVGDDFIGNFIDDDGTYITSVRNPSSLLTSWTAEGAGWSINKTVDDPCPAGYKVPEATIWREKNPNEKGIEVGIKSIGTITLPTTTKRAYTYWGEYTDNSQGAIYYPYYGYIDAENKTKVNNGQTSKKDVKTNSDITASNTLNTERYKSKDFTLNYSSYLGALWSVSVNNQANSAYCLLYNHMNHDSAKLNSGSHQKYSWFQWKNQNTSFPVTLTESSYTDTFFAQVNDPSVYNRNYAVFSKANALPIRCVVDNQ